MRFTHEGASAAFGMADLWLKHEDHETREFPIDSCLFTEELVLPETINEQKTRRSGSKSCRSTSPMEWCDESLLTLCNCCCPCFAWLVSVD